MKFLEFRILSESKKDLYAAIGKAPTDRLLKTAVDPVVSQMHDSVFGKGNHHIEIPLNNDIPEKVKSHIESQGDSLEDDDNVKLKTGRIAPISKYLARSNASKDVQDEHQNWVKNKVGNSKLVITRNASEVASASTGTHWDSCARATKKNSTDNVPAWNAMPAELHNGTLMAMHVHKDAVPNEHGQYDSKDVLGRAMIKRHESGIESENPSETTFHREDRKYGAFPESAKKAVDEFTAKNYPQKNFAAYKKSTLYNDDASDVKVNIKHPDIAHAFTAGHAKEVGISTQVQLLNNKKTPPHIIDAGAQSRHAAIRDMVGEKTTNPDTLRSIFNNPNEYHFSEYKAKVRAIKNENAPKDIIDAGAKHGDSSIREAAVRHPKATPEQIMGGLKDENSWVQMSASHNPNLNKDHVNYILSQDGKRDDDEPKINGITVRNAVKSKHATHEQINTGLVHIDKHVGLSAFQNPNIDKQNLLHAVTHHGIDAEVISGAIEHDKADHDVLAKALSHPEQWGRNVALNSYKMTPELFKIAKSNTSRGARENAELAEQKHNDIKARAAKYTEQKKLGVLY